MRTVPVKKEMWNTRRPLRAERPERPDDMPVCYWLSKQIPDLIIDGNQVMGDPVSMLQKRFSGRLSYQPMIDFGSRLKVCNRQRITFSRLLRKGMEGDEPNRPAE